MLHLRRFGMSVCVVLLAGPLMAQPGFRPGGFGGPGGPMREERKLLKEFDVDESGWLNQSERARARDSLKVDGDEFRRGSGRGGRGRGGPGRRGPRRGAPSEPAKPGPEVQPVDVANYSDHALYDTNIVRTMFLTFENEDWEQELEDFHGTDVDVPATLQVDGKSYPLVGVHFRGMSSYSHVQRGSKRSFNVALDLADKDQRLYGYKTLNLLNGHGDPSFLSSALYSHIARNYIPAPKANFVHVVVNGKSWGLYVSVQQFDKVFVKENFAGSKGTRWKVDGNPRARGGLEYLGEDLSEYKSRFTMKSNDGKKAWKALVELCRVLNETPLDELESALDPMLDIDGALKFLALDVALVNSDGYWTRASDYALFRDGEGRFHFVPHDMNEAFAISRHGPPRGGPPSGRGRPDERREPSERGEPRGFGPPPGFEEFLRSRGPGGSRGGPTRGGVELDPLIVLDHDRFPLRARLLEVPQLRERYLTYVQQIARNSLDWKQLGPVADGFRDLIEPYVKADTRKLSSYEAFASATRSGQDALDDEAMSLHKFAVQRRRYLLSAE